MEVPQLTSIDGAYVYLIGTIVGVAVLAGVYFLAVAAGLAPSPPSLVGAITVV